MLYFFLYYNPNAKRLLYLIKDQMDSAELLLDFMGPFIQNKLKLEMRNQRFIAKNGPQSCCTARSPSWLYTGTSCAQGNTKILQLCGACALPTV